MVRIMRLTFGKQINGRTADDNRLVWPELPQGCQKSGSRLSTREPRCRGKMAERSKALESGLLTYPVRMGASSNLALVKHFSSSDEGLQQVSKIEMEICQESPVCGVVSLVLGSNTNYIFGQAGLGSTTATLPIGFFKSN